MIERRNPSTPLPALSACRESPRPRTFAEAEAEREHLMQRARLLRFAWFVMARDFREPHGDPARGLLVNGRGGRVRPSRLVVDEVLGDLAALASSDVARAREIEALPVGCLYSPKPDR